MRKKIKAVFLRKSDESTGKILPTKSMRAELFRIHKEGDIATCLFL